MDKKVVVAMSGGVDSSVAAALLKKQGYQVTGITLRLYTPGSCRSLRRSCLQGLEDAARVSKKLAIRHYFLDLRREFKEKVISDFCLQYLKGRTPNPCVRCNQYIKFGILLDKASEFGASFLATGHYARIIKRKGPKSLKQEFLLKKAKDPAKDQSYFLYRLKQEKLKKIIFPLGDYTKTEVREIARDLGLSVADKSDSQEVCFLADTDYRGFLKAHSNRYIKPGLIVDTDGKVLGRHKGIAFYTVGQRQGLGIALGYPAYITEIDPVHNRITVGRKQDTYKQGFWVRDPSFILAKINKKIAANVRIRYNHREARAVIEPEASRIKVVFKQPQFAITPGQSAVFYCRDVVLGGGIIDNVMG